MIICVDRGEGLLSITVQMTQLTTQVNIMNENKNIQSKTHLFGSHAAVDH